MRALFRAFRLLLLSIVGFPASVLGAQVVDTLTVGFADPVGDLAWDGSTMWTCDRSGPIVRRDPTTGAILQTIRLRLPHVVDFGIEWDGRQLWVGAGDGSAHLYRLNPLDGSIQGSMYLRNDPSGGGGVLAIARKDEELWVLQNSGGDSYISRVDPVTGDVSNVLRRTEPTLFGLAWDGSAFVTCSYSAKMIYRIDPQTGRILSQFPGPSDEGSSLTGLGWDGRYLWVSSWPHLYKLDIDAQPVEPLRVALIQRGPRYAGRGKDLGFDGGLLWYTEVYGDDIYLLDLGLPSRVVRQLHTAYGPTGIERVGSSLWTTYNYFLGGDLIELNVDSGEIQRVLPFSPHGLPLGMDYDGMDLWVVGARMDAADSLYRVSTVDGEILAAIPSPGPAAAGVAWDGQSLWQTDQTTHLLYELDPASGEVRSQFELPVAMAHGIAFDPRNGTFWLTDDADRIYDVVLPSGATRLLRFDAAVDDGAVVVHWRTTHESNQREFVLERADAASGPYAEIARVDGAGRDYAVADPGPVAGHIYYYRLQALAASGAKVLGPLSVAFRFAYPPFRTPVAVQDLRAVPSSLGIRIEWRMDDDALLEIAAVHVERAPARDGPFTRLTEEPLHPEHSMSFEDRSIVTGSPVWYRLMLISNLGTSTPVGPVSASLRDLREIDLEVPVISTRGVEIRYGLGGVATFAHLAVYDGRGRCIRVLEHAVRGPGEHRVTWDGSDAGRRAVARGVYFVRLEANGRVAARRFVLLQR
jgi:streptogramin lyase